MSTELTKEFGSEPFIGWRTWSTLQSTEGDGTIYLMNWNRHHFWTPYVKATAVCTNEYSSHKGKDVVVPNEDCSCGIYAVKDPNWLFENKLLKFGIYGEVYLWGKVIEHEEGYKAQFAYPKSLFIVDKVDRTQDCLPLSTTYGVPCMYESFDTWAQIYYHEGLEKSSQRLPPRRAPRSSARELLRRQRDARDRIVRDLVNVKVRLLECDKEITRLEAACKPVVEL